MASVYFTRYSIILALLISSPFLQAKEELQDAELSLAGLKDSEKPSRSIFKNDRLELALGYSALVQAALHEGESAGSGEATLSGRYIIVGEQYPSALLSKLGSDQDGTLSIKFRLRHRHKLLDLSASELSAEVGSFLGTTDGFSNSGFEIPDLYVQQVFNDGKIELRYGQITVESRIDGHALRSAKTSFLNRVFSTNPTVAFPRFGAGATGRWQINDNFSLTGVLTQVQASKSGAQVDFNLNANDLFSGFQLGYEWGNEERCTNHLQLLLWGADSTEDLKQDNGFSLTFEQHYTEDNRSFFARIANSQGQQTDVDRMAVVGVGRMMNEEDLLGIGAGIGRSSRTNDIQGVLEVFYRYHAPHGIEITPDVEFIIGDGLKDGYEIVTGLRGIVSF